MILKSIKKDTLISFCFIFYILASYANFTQLLIHLFKIPSPISQLVNYTPLLFVLYGWYLIPRKKYYIVNKYFSVLSIFVLLYLTIGFLSTCFYNSLEQVQRVIPQYSRAILDVFLFLGYFLYLYEKKQSISNQLFSITIIFFIGTASVITFYLFGLELLYIQADQAYGLIERPSGLFANPNIAARNSCITLILLIYHLFNCSNTKRRIGIFILIFFTLFTVFITFSNTGQIAAIGILLIALIKGKILTKTSLTSILILSSVAIIVIQKSNVATFEFSSAQVDKIQNLYNVLTLNTQNVSYSSRDYIARETIRRCKENPVTGFGLGSYTVVYRTWGTHNTYLGLLLDAGVIPLVAFVFFLLYTGVKGFFMKDRLRDIGFVFMGWAFLIGIYAFASHNVIDNGKFYFLNIVFFVLYSCRKHQLFSLATTHN